jgi:hypothetical protein
MRKIYEHIEFTRVGHYQSILEAEGIRTDLRNLGASSAAGEIPFVQTFPELWVIHDEDYDLAIEILKPYHQQQIPEATPWICPNCNEVVDGTFGECWSCQTPQPDSETP